MKVFFPTYGAGHVKAIVPIADALKKFHSNVCVDILALTSSSIELDKSGLPYKKISQYRNLYTPEELDKIDFYGTKFSSLHFSLTDKDTIFYYGVSICELISEFGLEKTESLFDTYGRKIFEPLDFSRRLLLEMKPDKVFVTCGQRMELSIAKVANSLGIEVIRLLDLVIENLTIPYDCTLCVTNELAYNYALKSNEHLKKINITGNPNFMYENMGSNKKVKNKIVAIFTQPGNFNIESILDDLHKISLKMKHIMFLLKPHPNEIFEKYELLTKKFPNNFSLLKSTESKEIISNSIGVFTFYSSVGMEAIIQNKRLIVLNYGNDKFPVDYVKMGVADKVNDYNSLESTIMSFVDESPDQKFGEGYSLLKQPDNCVELILNVILDKNELS